MECRGGATNWLRYPALVVLLAVVVVLASGCGHDERGGSTAATGLDSGYPKGRDWEVVHTGDEWLRLTWDEYAYFDVWYVVRLLRDRKYSDSELVGIATRLVRFATERKITGVRVTFWPPDTPSNRFGSWAIASVVWGRDDSLDLQADTKIGDYSRHRFQVTYNYARNKRAGEANAFGL